MVRKYSRVKATQNICGHVATYRTDPPATHPPTQSRDHNPGYGHSLRYWIAPRICQFAAEIPVPPLSLYFRRILCVLKFSGWKMTRVDAWKCVIHTRPMKAARSAYADKLRSNFADGQIRNSGVVDVGFRF